MARRRRKRGISTDELLIFMFVSGAIAAVILIRWLVGQVSESALRWWLGLSFVVIPLVFIAGWRLGTRDSRAHLSGLDKGIDKVMGTADRVAGLRVSTIGRVRQARQPVIAQQPLALPEPEIVNVRPANQDEVIDL